ncbi:helix-turn-helix domain-containing protein [Halodesulfovibrio aestuarii]|uniref:DNA-binding transcriptional regulator, XRE-family HTH domain n=1 Tax=Halodesulfovibrio aestuarii TaxID=126333 RepID=A0A8G2FAG5_9BACT|nr:helix-turn-helix transcriptional regulator [Halodesulfovibrio aestuarii]SHI75048.1 DNA-binding transcriptional regulator, XRE-family HTH domain [Halodesulfovibrio aestuarii]
MNTLGSRIKIARGKLSQDAFSKQIGVSKGSLGFYERDENLPNTEVALKICSETGVSIAWLLSGEESEEPASTLDNADQMTYSQCPKCDKIEADLRKEREEVRELTKELREINAENRTLLKENGDLRTRLATLEARAAPTDKSPTDSPADAASSRKHA